MSFWTLWLPMKQFGIIIWLFILHVVTMPCNSHAMYRHAAEHSQVAYPDTIREVRGITVRARVVNGDTIPYIELKPVIFHAPRIFANRREAQRYDRLVYNIKKVYPYARLAGDRLNEYSTDLAAMHSDAQRRRALRDIEREVRAEFEADLMKLTRTQGMILIKLIDRETRHTPYNILRDFRGMVSAVFWQSLGRIFGYNLKTEYDPYGEDHLIEEIVVLIEMGFL